MPRDLPRHTLARRGVIVLVALAFIGSLISLRSNGTFGSEPHVSAVVADAGGALRKGSDVKMGGVLVGKVSSVERDVTGGVLIDMEMSEEDLEHVPANVVARVLPATVFGTTFVDLVVHGRPSEESLEPGADVKADRTQDTLEFQQALDDIDRLVNALGPGELASAIGSASQALEGRGDQLAATVSTLSSYLGRLNPRMPAVREDLRALATTVGVIDEVAPDLLDATEDALVFTNSLINQEAAITSLITGGTELAGTSTEFLSRNQQRLVRWIRGMGGFVDILYDNRRAGITDAMTLNIILGNKLPTVVKEGFLQADSLLDTDLPPYYGSGDRPSYASFGSMVGGHP
ncbi:MCE family protein [Nocardioides sp. HM23]|uniref:MCE family protein n=1 Tax=Nocardioides bizhenqiangii TaxID=3095076 RepID=UPI002ACA997D|nr:MCE family protein [Nocardioides sp. HM23]MDZ5620504.1 MCE family protein [Nocardioides sp. HM23]